MTPPNRSDTARREAPLVSVVIVSWNVRGLLLDCLAKLYDRAGGVPLEVFVVDNASRDGTPAAVARAFPAVRLIPNERNLGFPAANNQAIRLARGKYVLLLNPDTTIGEGTLSACLTELERDLDVGMVGCKLLLPDGNVQPECARNPYLLRDLIAELGYLHVLVPRRRFWNHHRMGDFDHLSSRDVEAISGAFMFVRRELLLELGGLPEDVFAGHEDLSLCLRVRKAGWRIRYLADVSTIHFANQSMKQTAFSVGLLEGECKLRLIREAQGNWAARAGRVVLAVRSVTRVLAGGVLRLVWPALKRKYPGVFQTTLHLHLLLWCIHPKLIAAKMPRPQSAPPLEREAASVVAG